MNRDVDKSGEAHTAYQTPTQEQIADRARELWEKAGRPEGRDVDHWLDAERSLRFPTNVKEEVDPAIPPTPPLPPPMGSAPSPTPPERVPPEKPKPAPRQPRSRRAR